jgi:Tol biopolymer transport system component
MKEIKRWDPSPLVGKVCLSSNGRYLAYRAGVGSEKRRRIVVIELNSGTETTLVEKEVGELVGWSPGDAKLLFSSDRTGTTGLWAITVREGKAAGEPELLKANTGEISTCGVTRDGSVYYTETQSSQYVYAATANFVTGEISRQAQRVTGRFPGLHTQPAWSTDGQKLMISIQGEQRRFVVVSVPSGEQKDFPVSDSFTMQLQQYAWSPDGTCLLVQSGNAAAQHGIHRYELASGKTETLITHVEGAWSCQPKFSLDGRGFYYARRTFSKEDWKDCIVHREFGSGKEEVVYESPEKLQIWWPFELSPDGKRFALVTSDQFRIDDFVVAIKVRDVSGGETKEVVRMAPHENVTSLSWTPDGKRLVYSKQRSGKLEVWASSVNSGESVELKFSLPNIGQVTVHPDGRQIAFRAGAWGDQELWVMEGLMTRSVVQNTPTPHQN